MRINFKCPHCQNKHSGAPEKIIFVREGWIKTAHGKYPFTETEEIPYVDIGDPNSSYTYVFSGVVKKVSRNVDPNKIEENLEEFLKKIPQKTIEINMGSKIVDNFNAVEGRILTRSIVEKYILRCPETGKEVIIMEDIYKKGN